jgi:nucleotide-binding universal stress UspA family protein
MHQIVVGVDGSDESWRAIEGARNAADPSDATVTAVYAEFLPSRAQWGLGESLDDVVLEEDEIRTSVTERLRAMNADGGPEMRFEIVKLKPVEAILKAAEDLDADLIVVGHRGHGGALKRLGSVALDVVNKSEVSVLVAR